MKNGFPTIAQLASEKEFWAVKNLCRRKKVTKNEALKMYSGKNVIEWVEHYKQFNLKQELCYYFPVRSFLRCASI